MSKVHRLLLLFLASCALPLLVAQVERASILGNAIDKSGAVVPNVQVTVTNEATNTSLHVITDQAGAYTVLNLIPGKYTIEASAPSFKPLRYRGVELQIGQQARLDFGMEVGAIEQTVEVTGAAQLLQTESAAVGQVIANNAVASLPLNGRNFVQLAILAPGVTGLDYAQSATINAGTRPDELRPGGTAVEANGASNYSNQVLLDGIDDTEMISHTFVVRAPVEGIQEFKVLTNNAGAEYGRAGGAVISMTSKSGGNDLHGSLFEYAIGTQATAVIPNTVGQLSTWRVPPTVEHRSGRVFVSPRIPVHAAAPRLPSPTTIRSTSDFAKSLTATCATSPWSPPAMAASPGPIQYALPRTTGRSMAARTPARLWRRSATASS